LAGALDPELLVGAELARPRPPRRQEDKLTPYEAVTTYNNFYEFGFQKEDPHRNAHTLRTRPWSVAVEGHVKKPAVDDLEDFIEPHTLEDRTYRLRCVEAWSMVIPWRGFPLADLIRRVEPTSQAKYVEFFTLHDGERAGERALRPESSAGVPDRAALRAEDRGRVPVRRGGIG